MTAEKESDTLHLAMPVVTVTTTIGCISCTCVSVGVYVCINVFTVQCLPITVAGVYI